MDDEHQRSIAGPQPPLDHGRSTEAVAPVQNGRIPGDTFPTETDPAQPVPATTARGSGKRAIREIVETLVLAVVIFVGVRLVVLNFRVDGLSMSPNLDNGEMLLVNRNVYFHFDLNEVINLVPGEDRQGQRIVYPFHPPERGDIIVFDPPVEPKSSKPYIKRVIALGGETVSTRGGYVYIDGRRLEEPYINGAITRCNTPTGDCPEVKVPPGSIFVFGDNRRNSSDSRVFGPVAIDRIVGKAWLGYWPWRDAGLVHHYDYPGIGER